MAVILIVEDEWIIREMAVMVIEEQGHQALSASTVDEALSLLHSHQNIDALFTDINLGTAGLGGCELAHQAIERRPKLPVLYTTGGSVTDKMSALFVKGAHVLSKPYTDHELQHSLEGLLAAYV